MAKLKTEGESTGELVVASTLRTPDEWRAAAFPDRNKRGMPHDRAWQHGAASALHRWPQHAHHAGAAIKLSGEDYYLALCAASTPDKRGDYTPHAAALGRY
jgi:hypothetical protein